ncbi:Hypothetical predicted protein [Paramuricea clavata]|uniref:Uncharacterized protein n=1 Tax=Paramuricea clavata TaxID=317549 RepID=A0A7D9IQD2_PARCT|nr:Hypothetical predicted protein [Paramuricea clavata]
MYVYSDIVDVQFVGDVKVPLLRIVNIEGEYGKNIHASFRNLQYVPVKVNSFESIEIHIKNDRDESVSFASGKSVATLHFRQKRSQYFAFTDVANKAVKTLTGRGRKRPIKRSAPAKPTISSQAKKRKTSHKVDKYNPNLPHEIRKIPRGYILNTDSSDKPGSHWVAVYLTEDGKGEFGDSYGKAPGFYTENFSKFLNKHCSTFAWNRRILQAPLLDEDTISILSHTVKMERVSRQQQCIRNYRKYRKRKKEQFEYFKKMEKYLKENHPESYHKFVEESSQEKADELIESLGL